MILGVLIALLVVSYILTFLSIYFGSKNFKYRTKTPFSFLNVFPCEFNITEKFTDNFYGNIFAIVSSLISIAFFCSYPSTFEGIYLVIFVFGVLTSIFNIMVDVTYLKSLKQHILFVSAQATANLMLVIIFLYAQVVKIYQNQLYLSFIPLIIAALNLIGLVFISIKSKLNFNLATEDVNGKYERKKIYWIVVFEWANKFSLGIIMLLMIISLVI